MLPLQPCPLERLLMFPTSGFADATPRQQALQDGFLRPAVPCAGALFARSVRDGGEAREGDPLSPFGLVTSGMMPTWA